MGTRFTAKWGPDVRRRVADAAFDPTRPTARAIHQGLVAAATGENGALSPTDIPPLATVATWVSEHRRDARDVLTGNPDQLDQLAADLMKRLRDQTRKAKTPTQITSCAKAARELAGLHRDLNRTAPAKPGAKARASLPDAPQDQSTTHSTPADDETAFLKTLEDDQRV
jgi:hypothetical protein